MHCKVILFTAHNAYFTQSELSQSFGEAKMEDPWEETPDQPQAELMACLTSAQSKA